MRVEVYTLSFFIFFICISNLVSQNEIILETDYTDVSRAKNNIQYPLDIFNRITPINGFNMPSTAHASLCIVRPLGGISKGGKADVSKDTYKWNGSKFVTDFTLLKKQIDGILSSGVGIHQIVLDNPSWAFQRHEDGTLPGESYKGETYGNAEPPKSYTAWANYLKDVMGFLIKTYGENEMLKIQFGIGREIGTNGHWTGSQEAFFHFYKKSVEAIHDVLPKAKVGTHFLWGSSKKSWGPSFVKWSKINNVHYDFVGVSYYPFYHRAERTNFTEVYQKDFAVIKDIPEWNKNARLEIHEFALIETMGSAGNTYKQASNVHQNAFMVGFIKMLYENDIINLFQWGSGTNYAPANREIFALKGNTYFSNTKKGTQNASGNYVDAIFTSDLPNNKYNIMAYNYNANPKTSVAEALKFVATINTPGGSKIKYRSAIYDKSTTLNWSAWKDGTTNGAQNNKSTFSFNAQLPGFSFLKYEVVVIDETGG